METAKTGWADRMEGGIAVALLRTQNGGSLWHDVTPPGQAVSSGGPGLSWFALDSESAWVVTNGPAGEVVMRTTDGGAAWQTGAPFHVSAAASGAGGGQLFFVSAEDGWLMTSDGAAAGSQAVTIYMTKDGGDTWKRVSTTAGGSGGLPFGCDKTGISFATTSVGWVTGVCAGGRPFLYKSSDGGNTWSRQTIASPTGGVNCQCDVSPPAFAGGSSVGYLLVAEPTGAGAETDAVYVTADRGRTWTMHPLPQTVSALDPVTPAMVVASSGGPSPHLWQTGNGGASWTQSAGDLPAQKSPQLDFVKPAVGWALGGPAAAPALYSTVDGGKTWTRLQTLLTG